MSLSLFSLQMGTPVLANGARGQKRWTEKLSLPIRRHSRSAPVAYHPVAKRSGLQQSRTLRTSELIVSRIITRQFFDVKVRYNDYQKTFSPGGQTSQ